MKELPNKTKKFLKETAEFINDEIINPNEGFRITLHRIQTYFKAHYNYGFNEGIIQGTLTRYPDEIRRLMNCYEAGVFSYLLLREFGFKPKLRLLEIIESRHPYGIGINYDHAFIELSDGEKKYYYDPFVSCDIIEKEEGNEIKLDDTTIKYKSSTDFTSLEDVIEKTEFLRSLEGQVQTLTQEYLVKRVTLLAGLADLSSSIHYDKEKKKFYTETDIRYRVFYNKRITIIDDLVKDKSTVSFKISSSSTFDKKPEIIRIDKELLDKIYELFNFDKTTLDNKFCPNMQISQLVHNEDLDLLSKELEVSEKVLKDLSKQINKVIKKYIKKIDKKYFRFFKAKEYFLNKKHEHGKKNYERFYTKKEMDNYYSELVDKILKEKERLVHLETEIQREITSFVSSRDQPECMTCSNPDLGERLKEMHSREAIECSIKEDFTDRLFKLRVGDSEYFYILLEAYMFGDKESSGPLLKKYVDKLIDDLDGFLGYKQAVADLISLYMFVKRPIELRYYKKKLFSIIKEYLGDKK